MPAPWLVLETRLSLIVCETWQACEIESLRPRSKLGAYLEEARMATRCVVVVLSDGWLVGSSRLFLDLDLQATCTVKSLPQRARMLSW